MLKIFFSIFLPLFLGGCSKVPLSRLYPQVYTAVSAWFEREQTVFVFYDVGIEEGFEKGARLELQLQTVKETAPWQPVGSFKPVHVHDEVQCGENRLCGSMSFASSERPIAVSLRVRYQPGGRLSDVLPLSYQSVESHVQAGESNDSENPRLKGGFDPGELSALVYGVFNSGNDHVQWRLRHQIPGIGNEEVRRLGLRRKFTVQARAQGPRLKIESSVRKTNPYGFLPLITSLAESSGGRAASVAAQAECPAELFAIAQAQSISTFAPAKWSEESVVPLAQGPEAALVCAAVTLSSATGEIQALAFALKNPRTEAAFGQLNSNVSETKLLPFLIAPCGRKVSEDHFEMQVQRLLMDTEVDVCLESTSLEVLTARISNAFDRVIDRERVALQDMTLLVAFHHDEEAPGGLFHQALLAALQKTIAPEQLKSSPRLVGAYVFDSYGNVKLPSELDRTVLWCPAALPTDSSEDQETDPEADAQQDPSKRPDNSQKACAVLPDLSARLGPVDVGILPIFPTRAAYERYLKDFGKEFAGRMLSLNVRAPRFTPETDNVALGRYRVASFFDGEAISTSSEQRFSYCFENSEGDPIGVRIPEGSLLPEELAKQLQEGGASARVLPLSGFPNLHRVLQLNTYDLGLIWDFPFLFSFNYQAFVAGSVSPLGANIPFGIDRKTGERYGSALWSKSTFAVADTLLKCSRFCNHPTFDSAGVYNIRSAFDEVYANRCYRPAIADGPFGFETAAADP